ncbi:putative iron export ATP-binding protein FetA [Caprobacter fermentans]|uniref:ATP-binding cassette domain-containing protein n=1 Tax=Caproicibacter fermentans TaxID=2576756 RepID=A0A6N8I4T5_9FIRM|nr:ATP-binding cassette domain-containing protein [Caproicibacter fermentans]MVB12777.1 putative iron export ATP-binding protein FetA [Caproicibacter fermentans]OCN01547.1 methionine ABC transporter ATP-binding protein [Clostridium sp. W14A]QNK40304.1 ATP-binding cassette domain-containing protein [Caproicibacter fermentans]
MTPQIAFHKVFYRSGEKAILKDLSLEIFPGDYISVVGPSGSGKSTFLKLCCHLISPTEGSILINGADVMKLDPAELRKKIGYCFQTPVLFGRTVEDNLSYPYRIRNRKMDGGRVNKLFSLFQMDPDYLKHEIVNLSGGEKQRIALIRSLLFQPEVLLLDEATSALDPENTLIVERVIRTLNQDGVTVLWITHNPEQSRKYAGRLLAIENGEIKSMEALK